MRLTKTLRDAFIRAAMADVPRIDYDEQIKKLVLDRAVELLPTKARACWEDAKSRPFLNTRIWYTAVGGVSVPAEEFRGETDLPFTSEQRHVYNELVRLHKEQYKTFDELRTMLTSVANSITTRKTLVERLPEFEKYLPAAPETSANLPALANVVTAFMTAGWPKGKEAMA